GAASPRDCDLASWRQPPSGLAERSRTAAPRGGCPQLPPRFGALDTPAQICLIAPNQRGAEPTTMKPLRGSEGCNMVLRKMGIVVAAVAVAAVVLVAGFFVVSSNNPAPTSPGGS